MKISHQHYLIIDFEATCSDDGTVPRDAMEIIEIGALVMDAQRFQVASEFQTFVRPVRHPQLTPFCRELTSITQADVDAALPFAEALTALQQWLAPVDDYLFSSWGNYDRSQLEQDCRHHALAYPFGREHLNLKAAFADALNLRKQLGIGPALGKLGLKFHGTPHRGIDDVRNVARIVQHVCAGG